MNNMYYQTSQNFKKSLISIQNILADAKAFVADNDISEEDFLANKLAEDMFDLKRQIQILTDNIKGYTLRMTETDPVVFEDNETTIDQLLARVERTIGLVESKIQSDFTNAQNVKVTMPFFKKGTYLTAADYTYQFAIPNVYFHAVTAYGLMRKAGMPLGKATYLGNLEFAEEV